MILYNLCSWMVNTMCEGMHCKGINLTLLGTCLNGKGYVLLKNLYLIY